MNLTPLFPPPHFHFLPLFHCYYHYPHYNYLLIGLADRKNAGIISKVVRKEHIEFTGLYM